MKTCRRCGVEKPADAFNSYVQRRGGRTFGPYLHAHCKECVNAYRREKYAMDDAYRARVNEANQQRYQANPEASHRRFREWCERNPERRREQAQRSQAANPDTKRRNQGARRARLREAFVEHVDPLVVLEMHDGACGICGGDVDPLDYHVDHVTPLSRGGFHNYANAAPAHPSCNVRKHNQLPEEVVTYR